MNHQEHELAVRELLGEDYFNPNTDLEHKFETLVGVEAAELDTWLESAPGFDAALMNWAQNVEHTERWQSAPVEQGVRKGNTAQPGKRPVTRMMRLDPKKFTRHVKATTKAKRYHGLEDILQGRDKRSERISAGLKATGMGAHGKRKRSQGRLQRLAAEARAKRAQG